MGALQQTALYMALQLFLPAFLKKDAQQGVQYERVHYKRKGSEKRSSRELVVYAAAAADAEELGNERQK